MKSCIIYKTKKFYKILTQSETEAGYLLSGFPVFVLSVDCNDNELANAVFESLESSKINIESPRREDFIKIESEVMQGIGEKNYVTLYRKSSSCELRLKNNETLTIYPNKYFNPFKPSQGLVWIKDEQVEISNPKENKIEIVHVIKTLLHQFR